MFGNVLASQLGANQVIHNASGQAAAELWRPVWHVGHLVFQAGIPRLKTSSLTGGGFIARKDPPAGHEQPSWQPYATPVSSFYGSGYLASRSNFLTPLGGNQAVSQF
jgi:hypothetical protein